MKKILTLLVGLFPAVAMGEFSFPSSFEAESVYVGGDISQQFSGFKVAKRSNTVTITEKSRTKNTCQFANAYAGYQITPLIAVEAGLFSSLTVNLAEADKNGQTRIKGVHGGLVFNVPVASDIRLLPGISMAYANVHASKIKAYNYKKTIWIPRASMAIQYKLNSNLNVRGSFVMNFMRKSYNSSQTMKMYDTMTFGIGLNYSL